MLQQPANIADLQRGSVADLLRLVDYPNDYVPVLTRHDPAFEDQPATERVDVIDMSALNERRARSYLVELLWIVRASLKATARAFHEIRVLWLARTASNAPCRAQSAVGQQAAVRRSHVFC